jgi:hypothetical protein
MEKVRSGKRARRPVEWINGGSSVWFARLITGRPVGDRRILVASVSWALFMAAVFSLFGFALGDVIRAI